MVLAGLNPHMEQNAVMGAIHQSAIVHEFANWSSPVGKLVTLVMFGSFIYYLAMALAKKVSIGVPFLYLVIAPFVWNLSMTTVPIETHSVDYVNKDQIAAEITKLRDNLAKYKKEQLAIIKEAKTRSEKQRLKDQLNKSIEEKSAAIADMSNTKLERSVGEVPLLYALFFDAASIVRGNIFAAIAGVTTDTKGQVDSGSNNVKSDSVGLADTLINYQESADQVILTNSMMAREMDNVLNPAQMTALKSVGACRVAYSAYRVQAKKELHEIIMKYKTEAESQGDKYDPKSITAAIKKQGEDNIKRAWDTALVACNLQFTEFMKQIINDPSTKAAVAKARSDLNDSMLDSKNKQIFEKRKKDLLKAFGFEGNYGNLVSKMGEVGIAEKDMFYYLIVAEGQVNEISNKVNQANTRLQDNTSLTSPGEGGLLSSIGGAGAEFLSSFAMYGKVISQELHYKTFYFMAIAFPFMMLIGLIPGMHGKMFVVVFCSVFFIHMWALTNPLINASMGYRLEKSLNMGKFDVKTRDSGLRGVVPALGDYAAAGVHGLIGKDKKQGTGDVGTYVGALFAGKAIVSLFKAAKKYISKLTLPQLTRLANPYVIGTAVAVGVGEKANDTMDEAMAFQLFASGVGPLTPLAENILNGQIEWQRERLQKTIANEDVLSAILFTMAPLITGIVFMGLGWKGILMMDAGSRGAQMATQGGMTAMFMAANMMRRPGGGGKT